MIENYVRNGEVARVRRRSSLVLRVLWYVMQYPRKLLDDFMDEVSVYVCECVHYDFRPSNVNFIVKLISLLKILNELINLPNRANTRKKKKIRTFMHSIKEKT